MTTIQHQHDEHQLEQQQQSVRVFDELCSLVLHIIGSPPHPHPLPPAAPLSSKQLSPAGFACLLLGISLSLMLCGSVTFVLGFILMPWVVGFLLLFYLFGVVSTMSRFSRAVLCPPSLKEMPAWDFS